MHSSLLAVLLFLLLLHGARGCYRRRAARIRSLAVEVWHPWSEWGPCSTTCGVGMTRRKRRCAVPARCEDSVETEIKRCVNMACQNDMGGWTPWSPCTTTCGRSGITERSRKCNGVNCRELVFERKPCPMTVCPVNGAWSPWSDWSPCSVTCGDGSSYRIRSCTNPKPEHGGSDCSGAPKVAKTCILQKYCQPPVDGGWTPWAAWSSCSRTCGEGSHTRLRNCSAPAPAFGGRACAGAARETGRCVLAKFCGPAVDGGWGSWSPWTTCDVACGNGTSHRLRSCSNPAPANGGRDCLGPRIERRACQRICPVDGGWSAWRIERKCWPLSGKPCSRGREAVVRTCDNPKPALGGLPCNGKPRRVEDCWYETGCPEGLSKPLDFETKSFPNKTLLVTWREAPYGDRATNFVVFHRPAGASESPRSVVVRQQTGGPPAPVSGRLYSRLVALSAAKGRLEVWMEAQRITGDQTLRSHTAKQVLVVGETDGGWSSWTMWSDCSVTCGDGFSSRRRRCDNPKPSAGGRDCRGEKVERQICDSGEFCS